jgi:hypothetical protein
MALCLIPYKALKAVYISLAAIDFDQKKYFSLG